MHRRLQPKYHEFIYKIFLFYIDLDEIPQITNAVPIFSANEANLYSLNEEDYFQLKSGSIRDNVMLFLKSQGVLETPTHIRLLTLPRLLGYTFNPISIFFCFDAKENPLVSVIQVGNTFGELKPFAVPFLLKTNKFQLNTPKNFYVSPFSNLDLSFDFRFDNPGKHLRVMIDDYSGAEKKLVSTLTGKRTEFTFSNLVMFTLKYPFITLKVIALIHWEAMRLWWKGIPHHLKEANPHLQQGIFQARE